MMFKVHPTAKTGFTLLELIIVIMIVSAMVAFAMPRYTSLVEKARSTEAIQILGLIKRSQNRYCMSNNNLPTFTVSDLDTDFTESELFETPTIPTPSSPLSGTDECFSVLEYVGAVQRKGDLYTLYLDALSDIYCSESTTDTSLNYCEQMGYKVIDPPADVCFLEGTKVVMADGSLKNIEDIKTGELLKSYNEVTKQLEPKTVTQLFRHTEIGGYVIINHDLYVTPNHPFLHNDQWIEIGQLKAGDNLTSADHQNIPIHSTESVFTKVDVYNLEVEDNHTYCVRMNNKDIIVHNKKPLPSPYIPF